MMVIAKAHSSIKRKKWLVSWLVGLFSLSCHPSAFFSADVARLRASFAMVNVMPFTFSSTCIADISAQIAKLLCKLAVHRHQCCRCPTNSSAFSVDLYTACHHLDILLFKIRSSTELACFGASHAGIYAALPFCILKCYSSRHPYC
jgi:hypothetical protein